MSVKENKRRVIASAVLRQAWKMHKRTEASTWPTVLKLAWGVVRSRVRIHYSKAFGVAAIGTSRQGRLQQITRYTTGKITLRLVRDVNNTQDTSAVRVVVSIDRNISFTAGYVRRELAAGLSQLIDEGRKVVAFFERVTGPGSKGLYGLNYSYAVI